MSQSWQHCLEGKHLGFSQQKQKYPFLCPIPCFLLVPILAWIVLFAYFILRLLNMLQERPKSPNLIYNLERRGRQIGVSVYVTQDHFLLIIYELKNSFVF